jgi:hypothetical protein
MKLRVFILITGIIFERKVFNKSRVKTFFRDILRFNFKANRAE